MCRALGNAEAFSRRRRQVQLKAERVVLSGRKSTALLQREAGTLETQDMLTISDSKGMSPTA